MRIFLLIKFQTVKRFFKLVQQKRKYTKKKNCDIEIYSSGENPNGINDINTNLQFPDLMISNDVLMEMKNQKSKKKII